MWLEYPMHICLYRLPDPALWMLLIKHHSYYRRCKTKYHWRSVDALLTLCWRWFSGCGWEREYPCFAHQGGEYADNEPWPTNVNTLRLAVAYLNPTINVKPETQNRRLDPTGLAKPGETRGLTGKGPGLARQESAGRVFDRVWNRTDPFLRSKPGPLVGYADPLLTLCAPGLCGELCSWIHGWIQDDGCRSDRFGVRTDHSFFDTYDITHLNFVSIFRH